MVASFESWTSSNPSAFVGQWMQVLGEMNEQIIRDGGPKINKL